jgi:hypothetical protein
MSRGNGRGIRPLGSASSIYLAGIGSDDDGADDALEFTASVGLFTLVHRSEAAEGIEP